MKLRHKNWYWGRFVFSGQKLDSSKVTLKDKDFEPYIEELHGWQHSEEYKKSYSTDFSSCNFHTSFSG